MMTDEYTALQKYISTYKDPKAAAQENGADDAGGAEKKKKPWWKVSSRLLLTVLPMRLMLTFPHAVLGRFWQG